MSNLVFEILIRLIKPALAIVLGAIVYLIATSVGEPGSVSLALLSFLCGGGFILLVQESPL